MNYTTFKTALITNLRAVLKEEYSVEFGTSNENGTLVEYLHICNLKQGTSQNIGLSTLYQSLSGKDITLDSIVNFITNFCSKIMNETAAMDTTKIVYQLVNMEEYKQHLNDLPHIPFYDMALIFSYVSIEKSERIFLTITNKMAEANHLSLQNLVDIAQVNISRIFPSTLMTLGSYSLEQTLKESHSLEEVNACLALLALESNDEMPTNYVLSSKNYCFGATALMDTAFLNRIADELKSDLFILPSSETEFIIHTEAFCENEKDLRELADFALSTGKEKILTRQIFRYSRATKQLQQIA